MQSFLVFCEGASLSCSTCSVTPPTCFHTDSATTYTCTSCTRKPGCCTLIGLVKATEQADGRHPAIHVLLRLSHQVPGALLGLQVKDEGSLQLLLGEGQASVHLRKQSKEARWLENGNETLTHDVLVFVRIYLFTQVEVNGSDGPSGMLVLVVLQDIRLPTQAAASQHEPALFPGLQGVRQSLISISDAFDRVELKETSGYGNSAVDLQVANYWTGGVVVHFLCLCVCVPNFRTFKIKQRHSFTQ